MDFDSFEAITFDCYGTLIDWETGMLGVLRPLLAKHGIHASDDQMLAAYGELEPAIQAAGYLRYRLVLAEVVRRMGRHFGFSATEDEASSLADSLPGWTPFPDTVEGLRALKSKYRVGIISNTDDDLFAGTAKHLKVEFDWVITAEQARAYKPERAIFELALARIGQPAEKILHVGQSIYHDVVPAKAMGMGTVLVTRRGFGATKRVSSQPDEVVPDVKTLAQRVTARTSAAR
jgi:2-haloacid dehalogenase